MFAKKKKKIEISAPSNFQHRVHTGFDPSNNKFVGLPLQWHSIVRDEAGASSPHRPHPVVDPSTYTPVKGDPLGSGAGTDNPARAGSVVRSNSLRASSPPRMRREQSNLLPSVPEHNGNEEDPRVGRSVPYYPTSNQHTAGYPGIQQQHQQQQQQYYGVNSNNMVGQPPPLSRPNSVLYSGPSQHQQPRFSPPGGPYNNIQLIRCPVASQVMIRLPCGPPIWRGPRLCPPSNEKRPYSISSSNNSSGTRW